MDLTRVIVTQEATDNPPNQPEGATLTSHMEINGLDGTNPNHNYNPNPNPNPNDL